VIDPTQVLPGDVLFGFSPHGPATVVSNKPGFGDTRELKIQIGENTRLTVNVHQFSDRVKVLRSSWR
jgi:hypothetical protein